MTDLNEKKVAESTFLTVKDRISQNVELIVSPSKFQVGLSSLPADFTVFGRTSLSIKNYTFDKSHLVQIESYVTIATIITPIDSLVPRPSYLSVTLPGDPRVGQIVIVKDYSGICGLIPIRIFDASGVKIDGSDYQQIITNYGNVTFSWNNGTWFTIS